uniref:transglutaminase-like domain-containing protein n=1 Tax=Chitinivorax sp. B TaxID=2502235 RepID=UPI0010F554AE
MQTSPFAMSALASSLLCFMLSVSSHSLADTIPVSTSAAGYASALNALDASLTKPAPVVTAKSVRQKRSIQAMPQSAASPNEVQQQRQRLDTLASQVDAEFKQLDQHLQAQQLPPEIRARLREAQVHFQAQQQQLRSRFESLEQAERSGQTEKRQQATDALKRFVREGGPGVDQPVSSPPAMQWGRHLNKVRPPIETSTGYRQKVSLFGIRPLLLAGPIPSGTSLPSLPDLTEAPTPADLAPTEDAPLNAAIKEKAQSLNNQPVAIYSWVRNNIQFAPTYGAIQGAETTLQTRRGNAFDTASLLVGLLRAAGVPARYVYATIEVPAERVMNWVGGVETPEAALNLLAQGGIPSIGVATAGRIQTIKLEHVWVEAFVDFVPSRGAVNREPDTWVAMDATFKQDKFSQGMSLSTALPFDTQSFLDLVKTGADINAAQGWVKGIDSQKLAATVVGYREQFNQFVNHRLGDPSLADIVGRRHTPLLDSGILTGLPSYKVLATAGRFTTIPSTLRWQYRYQLFASEADQMAGRPMAAVERSLPMLAGHRLTVAFVPATAADRSTLASLLPAPHADGSPAASSEFPSSLPGYLIHVTPEIKLDGEVLAKGGEQALGSQVAVGVDVYDPRNGQWALLDRKPVTAGETQALAISPQQVSAASLQAMGQTLAETAKRLPNAAGLTHEDVTGNLLHSASQAFFATSQVSSAMVQRAAGVVEHPLPSFGQVTAAARTTNLYGIPVSVSFPGIAVTLHRMDRSVVALDNDAAVAARYLRHSAQRDSTLIHNTLDKLFVDASHPGEAVSAIRALARSNAQGQKLFTVGKSNLDTALAAVQTGADIKQQVRDAVQAGRRAVLAEGEVSVGAWRGAGFIVDDEATGSGRYVISGDMHGGLFPVGGTLPLAMSGAVIERGLQNALSTSVGSYFQNTQQTQSSLTAVIQQPDDSKWQAYPVQQTVVTSLLIHAIDSVPANVAGPLGSWPIVVLAGAEAGAGNLPPQITSAPTVIGRVGERYQYQVQAFDPDGNQITYRLLEAPAGMIMDAGGLIRWQPGLQGAANVALVAEDGRGSSEQRFSINIQPAQTGLEGSLAVEPQIVDKGQPVNIFLTAQGGMGATKLSLTMDGRSQVVDAAGQATLANADIGKHVLIATFEDDKGTKVTREGYFIVRDPADSVTPVVELVTPSADSELTAPVKLMGTASAAKLVDYKLLIAPAGSSRFAAFGGGKQAVVNGELGKLDVSQYANGVYDIALQATAANGQTTTTKVTYQISGNLKVGQFSACFADLSIEAAGIPVQVTRCYDSRRKTEALDFGFGWSVDYQQVKVQSNRTLGLAWRIVNRGGNALGNWCVEPMGKHFISVTLPEGKIERFDFDFEQACQVGVPPSMVKPVFLPRAGTTSKLQVADAGSLMVRGGQLFDVDGNVFDPTGFTLT